MKSIFDIEIKKVMELMSPIQSGERDKFVKAFEESKPANTHYFLDRAIMHHDDVTGAPENKDGQQEIATFLFQSYVNSALNKENSVWQEKDYPTGEFSDVSFPKIARNISSYLTKPYLEKSLDDETLREVLKFTKIEEQQLIDSPSTSSPEDVSMRREQLLIIARLNKKVDDILDQRETSTLLSEVDGIFHKLFATPKSSDGAKNAVIENLRNLFEDTETSGKDKIKELQSPLLELAELDPDFKKQFSQILLKIGKLVGVIGSDEATRENTSQPSEPSTPRPDIIVDENPKSSRPDLIDDEIQGATGNPSQKTAKQIQEEEDEEKRRLAAGQNSDTNHYNHNSTSHELDPTKLAAISLKMAAVLAIALGIGGPAGFILAIGFMMVTNNIANGKEVNYISPPNQMQNMESPINEDMIKQLIRSSQSQAAPTHQAATEADKQFMNKLGGEVAQIDTTLLSRRDRLEAANAEQTTQRARTDEVLDKHSPRSVSTRGGSDIDGGHSTSR
jgi:hypothetical protein